MRTRLAGVLCSIAVTVALSAAPQAPVPAHGSAKVWEGRHAEFEEFLRTAPFQRVEEVPIGVTKPLRAHFAPGGPAASVAWKVLPPGRQRGFWESYKSEIAAYELDKALDLNMVPPVVERRWKGDLGAAILWLAPVRSWKEVEHAPKPDRWNIQVVRMKMFDNLIGNIDRNAGNLLVDAAWNLFLIDHSRAFVTETRLPAAMTRVDRDLWTRMSALDEPTASKVLGRWVDRASVRALLKRRDRMREAIDALVKGSSEAAIFIKRP
jgi:hypothetical protein